MDIDIDAADDNKKGWKHLNVMFKVRTTVSFKH